jgi:hypothetical protein
VTNVYRLVYRYTPLISHISSEEICSDTETGLAIYKSPFLAKIAGFTTQEEVALRSFLEANPLKEGEYIAANNGGACPPDKPAAVSGAA